MTDAAKGYVLTNHHVVDGRTEISVTLGTAAARKAHRQHKETDIALLQIEAENLTAIQIAIPMLSRSAITSSPSVTRSVSARR